MTTTQPSKGNPATHLEIAEYWAHLDCIYLEDGDLVSRAAATVEQVKAALLSGQPIDRAALALLLDYVGRDLRQAVIHLDNAVELLGDAAMIAH